MNVRIAIFVFLSLILAPGSSWSQNIPRTPRPGWKDSYSVGGKCYCDSTFDHNIGSVQVSTPQGSMTVRAACEIVNATAPGVNFADAVYNDIQCGNGPANDAGDEDYCPGRVDQGKAGCLTIGPKWDPAAFTNVAVPEEDTPPSDPFPNIPRTPRPGWKDSYSVGDKCYCDSNYDHGIGSVLVDTPAGMLTIPQACELVNEDAPSISMADALYNDVQCGNGPANNAGDEDYCPGRVDLGKAGCLEMGPKWDPAAFAPAPPPEDPVEVDPVEEDPVDGDDQGASDDQEASDGGTNDGDQGEETQPAPTRRVIIGPAQKSDDIELGSSLNSPDLETDKTVQIRWTVPDGIEPIDTVAKASLQFVSDRKQNKTGDLTMRLVNTDGFQTFGRFPGGMLLSPAVTARAEGLWLDNEAVTEFGDIADALNAWISIHGAISPGDVLTLQLTGSGATRYIVQGTVAIAIDAGASSDSVGSNEDNDGSNVVPTDPTLPSDPEADDGASIGGEQDPSPSDPVDTGSTVSFQAETEDALDDLEFGSNIRSNDLETNFTLLVRLTVKGLDQPVSQVDQARVEFVSDRRQNGQTILMFDAYNSKLSLPLKPRSGNELVGVMQTATVNRTYADNETVNDLADLAPLINAFIERNGPLRNGDKITLQIKDEGKTRYIVSETMRLELVGR